MRAVPKKGSFAGEIMFFVCRLRKLDAIPLAFEHRLNHHDADLNPKFQNHRLTFDGIFFDIFIEI